ncbi:MAG TPA: hypothetical protein DDY68_05470 [Porphyromonadaceae bacterium]|nr:hypothetical protein [Porphyromonadaceae bacterium]
MYCSTNMQEELNLGERYNKESVKFQFDFLNDFIPSPNIIQYNTKLPQGLLEALRENKPIVFFLNPPYARAGKSEEGEGTMGTMKGTAKTSINAIMKQEKIGACSANLYAQFLYRIAKIKQEYNLTHVHIALYSPTLFLTGSSWEGFRKFFFKEFDFCQGVQFNAAYFSNVKSTWGISFSIWKNGETQNKNSFPYDLIEEKEGEIQIIGKKTIYNLDGEIKANRWIKDDGKRDIIFPNCSSAIKITNGDNRISKNTIGTFLNDSNNVDRNEQDVAIFSGCVKKGGNPYYIITPENFTKCTALFAARKLIACDWINSKDEYLAPNEENPHYNEFVEDSVVFSLFHSSSNQSSLRNIDYKGKKWNIKNEFFFMSRKDIMSLANENDNEECYEDAKIESTERFVYLYLKGKKLSQEANVVLEKAIEIVKLTFPYRGLFNDSNPNYQVMNWDCGWYQIKAIAEEYANKEYEEFRKLFLLLAKKMRPLVYELGFLKK